jgi:hypothetical protein
MIRVLDTRFQSFRHSIAKGDQGGNLLSKEEIVAKFWTNVDFYGVVSKGNTEKILALVEHLEKLDSVNNK